MTTASVTPLPGPFTVQPVPHGLAEQLARVAHFRELDHPEAHELNCVARFLIGDVGGRDAADLLWVQLRDDCLRLWHLVTDDWDDRDLDELTAAQYERLGVCSYELEQHARFERTRDRLSSEIETAVHAARYRAVAARRASGHRDGALAAAVVRHPAGSLFPGGAA